MVLVSILPFEITIATRSHTLAKPFRPVNAEGERLTPEALELLQNSADRPEDFKAPCCVCPHRSDSVWHLECEITMDLDGHYVGEYVARCAMEACKYLSTRQSCHPFQVLLANDISDACVLKL